MRLTQIIEALLFASDAPLTAADLARVDERLDEDTVEAVIEELRSEYETTERSFQVYELAGGYQLLTRPEFVSVLERYESVPQPSRLSTSALEVLAIIAYRQPLGRAEVEEIRGVGSSGVLRTLQDRGLINAVGRAEGLGRPLLYGTTAKFLEHFGYRSLEDLPRPDELPVVLRDRSIAIVMQPDPAEGTPAEAAQANAHHSADLQAIDEQASLVAEVAADDVVVGPADFSNVEDADYAPPVVSADPDTLIDQHVESHFDTHIVADVDDEEADGHAADDYDAEDFDVDGIRAASAADHVDDVDDADDADDADADDDVDVARGAAEV